jgi:hypothetical protein
MFAVIELAMAVIGGIWTLHQAQAQLAAPSWTKEAMALALARANGIIANLKEDPHMYDNYTPEQLRTLLAVQETWDALETIVSQEGKP